MILSFSFDCFLTPCGQLIKFNYDIYAQLLFSRATKKFVSKVEFEPSSLTPSVLHTATFLDPSFNDSGGRVRILRRENQLATSNDLSCCFFGRSPHLRANFPMIKYFWFFFFFSFFYTLLDIKI